MLTIYKASAGSGKTYTLAKDYISLLLGLKIEGSDPYKPKYQLNLAPDGLSPLVPNQHRHILAITFTRKATEEMKSRILKELDLLADPNRTSDYAPEMQQRFECSRQRLAEAASFALRQILFDYHNFNVSTIDAFFQRVLHTFARELDRQSDYNIELNDTAAMQAAVGVMLDNFNAYADRSPELEKWLFDFMSTKIDEGTKSNFFNRRSRLHTELVSLVAKISQESFKPYSAAMREYLKSGKVALFAQALANRQQQLLLQIRDAAQQLTQGIDIDMLGTAAAIKMVRNYMLPERPIPLSGWKEALKTKYMRQLLDTDVECTPKVAFKNKYGTTEQAAAVRQLFIMAYSNTRERAALAPIVDSLTQLGLLAHAWDYLIQFTEDNNTLLIADTNELVSRIIGTDDTPFIYERMGVRLNSFLIDEFQDTSMMQWDNLRPLVGNGLAEGHDSLVIGDEKQSIYRFRNSDSSILHTQVGSDLADYLRPAKDQPSRSTNYRSAPIVVRFNNSLFSIMAEITQIEGFENVIQCIRPEYKDMPGYVRFMPTPKKEKKPDPDPDGAESEDVDKVVMHQMAQEILRQLNQGHYLGKDIAVLVNTNAQATKVVNFLLQNYLGSIHVLSDEALHLTSSSAVQLIISMLKIIDQEQTATPKPDPDPAEPRRYPSRTEIILAMNRFEYYYNKEYALMAEEVGDIDPDLSAQLSMRALSLALADNPDGNGIADTLRLIRQKRAPSLVSLIETIAGVLLSEAERREQFAFIAALQDIAIEFSSRQSGSLHAFLEWWKVNGPQQTITGASNQGAVRVMTIHKSKGLEFHCVHIPFAKWPVFWSPRRSPNLWTQLPPIPGIDPEVMPPVVFVNLDSSTSWEVSPLHSVYLEERGKSLVDMMNKTYVAFTRARSELLVWYNPYINDTVGTLLPAAFETGLPPVCDPKDLEDQLLINLCEYFNSESGILTIGGPTVKADQTAAAPAAPVATSDRIGEGYEPYPVVFRNDSASEKIALDDIFSLDRDIDDDSAAAQQPHQPQEPDPDMTMLQQGLDLHYIMQRIYTPDDIDRAVAAAVNRRRIDRQTAQRYKALIREFVNTDDVRISRWFSPQSRVYIEQPIYVPNMNFIRRPDRIVVRDDGSVDVIDYKFTNDASQVATADQLAQVREYMSLMRDLGYDTVRGFLCFPFLKKIIRI